MDFWASLEHGLKSKAVHASRALDLSDELLYCRPRYQRRRGTHANPCARAMDTE